ncbi:glycosyltransferase [Kaistella sp. DKR-2]|uniref:glycosyltransferase n=1 Tax=Kaistella soli TaxID=2849654 RepID=UPI001C2774DE|nr:glycosyltransferase [Kaistella soli]MBU8883067.1 glycosyltransferase [Kaistella soli]
MSEKKDILFVMNNLNVGGAEKALVSLLQVMDYDRYNIDLLLFKKEGLFLKQVPQQVNILPEPENYRYFDMPFSQVLKENLVNGSWEVIYRRIQFKNVVKKAKSPAEAEQLSWKPLSKTLSPLKKKYDAAIGFLEKNPNYFIVDRVLAKTKIGFIHNDYNQLKLNKTIDAPYFRELHYIATVSEECARVLENEFPDEADKVKFIPNIVSAALVQQLSKDSVSISENAIVSVGRLEPQKGFDLAIEAARILVNRKIDFHWYIIGEGSERTHLESLVLKYELEDYFTLLGLKENPYPYIRQAKTFVQPSRFEGKSIAVDEAKILGKPIVLTNFSTAKDQIDHDVNGMIVEMNPHSLAKGIMKCFSDFDYLEKITLVLNSQSWGTEHEIQKLYILIEN